MATIVSPIIGPRRRPSPLAGLPEGLQGIATALTDIKRKRDLKEAFEAGSRAQDEPDPIRRAAATTKALADLSPEDRKAVQADIEAASEPRAILAANRAARASFAAAGFDVPESLSEESVQGRFRIGDEIDRVRAAAEARSAITAADLAGVKGAADLAESEARTAQLIAGTATTNAMREGLVEGQDAKTDLSLTGAEVNQARADLIGKEAAIKEEVLKNKPEADRLARKLVEANIQLRQQEVIAKGDENDLINIRARTLDATLGKIEAQTGKLVSEKALLDVKAANPGMDSETAKKVALLQSTGMGRKAAIETVLGVNKGRFVVMFDEANQRVVVGDRKQMAENAENGRPTLENAVTQAYRLKVRIGGPEGRDFNLATASQVKSANEALSNINSADRLIDSFLAKGGGKIAGSARQIQATIGGAIEGIFGSFVSRNLLGLNTEQINQLQGQEALGTSTAVAVARALVSGKLGERGTKFNIQVAERLLELNRTFSRTGASGLRAVEQVRALLSDIRDVTEFAVEHEIALSQAPEAMALDNQIRGGNDPKELSGTTVIDMTDEDDDEVRGGRR